MIKNVFFADSKSVYFSWLKIKETKKLISNSYLIRQSFQGYHYNSGIGFVIRIGLAYIITLYAITLLLYPYKSWPTQRGISTVLEWKVQANRSRGSWVIIGHTNKQTNREYNFIHDLIIFLKTCFLPILQVRPSVVSSDLFSTLIILFGSIVSPETGLFSPTGGLSPPTGRLSPSSGRLFPTPWELFSRDKSWFWLILLTIL